VKIIESNKKQKTIKKKTIFNGQSLFSPKYISMELLPADEDYGIKFNINREIIPATSDYLNTVELHTTSLSNGKETVIMVEHLLAAIYGLGIDNIEIKMNQSIVPAQDGSSLPYATALENAGIVEQNKYRNVIMVDEVIEFEQPEFEGRKAYLKPLNNSFRLTVTAPFEEPIGTYTVQFKEGDDFTKNISWARTFLRSPLDLNDLSKWNGIRTVYKALPENPKDSPIITFTKDKFLTPLKKRNEPATHKLLDTLGDLALVGYRIYGDLEIYVPGHKFTHYIAKEIRKYMQLKVDDEF